MDLGGEREMAVDATSKILVEIVLPSRKLPGMAGSLSSIPLLDENGSDNSAVRESRRKNKAANC
jgi:hypothetical protein